MVENSKEEKLIEQIRKMELIVRQFLTAEALQRLNNLKIAHQDRWLQVLTLLYQLIASGQIRGKITEEQLKRLLSKLSEKERRRTRIRFIHR